LTERSWTSTIWHGLGDRRWRPLKQGFGCIVGVKRQSHKSHPMQGTTHITHIAGGSLFEHIIVFKMSTCVLKLVVHSGEVCDLSSLRWIVAQVFRMNINTIAASDRKPAARRFLLNNRAADIAHLFSSFEDQLHGIGCLKHGPAECDAHAAPATDCFVSGLPCQAWSRLRAADKTSTPPSSHYGWALTFDTFFRFLAEHAIKGGYTSRFKVSGTSTGRLRVKACKVLRP
jgi:hypothetical protein